MSWNQKVFVAKAPVNVSAVGMNLSPLMASAVVMSGDGAVQTYRDDTAIRQSITLLPSGYYGAAFTGIALHSVANDVQLNFTLSYPGGQNYDDDVTLNNAFPPIPYSRMALGFYTYTPTWTNQVPSHHITSHHITSHHSHHITAGHVLAHTGQSSSNKHEPGRPHCAGNVPRVW